VERDGEMAEIENVQSVSTTGHSEATSGIRSNQGITPLIGMSLSSDRTTRTTSAVAVSFHDVCAG
jgi:hypothetical protein